MWKKILQLFTDGMAPSTIDKVLGLTQGTAHDIIVHNWTWTSLARSDR